MKSGLNEPLGLSAIDRDADQASSFDLPTTNLSKRYLGLKTAAGRSSRGGVEATCTSSIGDSGSTTKCTWIRSGEIAVRMLRICWPYLSRISSMNRWEGTLTSTISPFWAAKRVGANQVT